MRRTAFVALAALAVLCMVSPAGATVLNPGDSNISPITNSFYDIAGGQVMASFTSTETNGGLQATLTAAVVKETGGTLDFLYQVTNVGTAAIERVTATDFTGWWTDVSYGETNVSGFAPSTAGTSFYTASRATTDAVGFNILDTANQTSYVLVIKTDAYYYHTGDVFVQDGGQVNFSRYAPATPEPASLAIAGLGALGLLGYAWKRRKA